VTGYGNRERASVSPRSAPITASPSTSRLPTVSNRGLTSTMRAASQVAPKTSGLRRKLVRSRPSILCRTVLDLQPCCSLHRAGACHHRTRTPELETPADRIPISKAVLFNDIDRWVFRCALVEVDVAAERSSRLVDAVIGLRYTSSYLTLRQKRSRNTLFAPRAPASMLMQSGARPGRR